MKTFIKQTTNKTLTPLVKVFNDIVARNAYTASDGEFCIVKDDGMYYYNLDSWLPIVKKGTSSKIGTVKMYYKPIDDPDWLECNGSAFDTTAYPELYEKLGSDHLPQYQDNVLAGETTSLSDLGQSYSAIYQSHNHTLTDDPHTHEYTQTAHSHQYGRAGGDGVGTGSDQHREWSGNNTINTGWIVSDPNDLIAEGANSSAANNNLNTVVFHIEKDGINIGDTYDHNDPDNYDPHLGNWRFTSWKPNRFAVFYYIKAR